MRNGHRRLMTGLFLGMLIAAPREAAAYWDWIHELSGPSLVGLGYNCKINAPRPFGGRTEAKKAQFLVVTQNPFTLPEGATLIARGVDFSGKPVERTTTVTTINATTFIVEIDANALRPDLTFAIETAGGTRTALPPSMITNRSISFAVDQCFRGSRPDDHTTGPDDLRMHWWVRGHAYFFYSVKHDDDPEGPPVYAGAFGGLFEVSPSHPARAGHTVLFFGAGYERFVFDGSQFDRFGRNAWKIRPFAIRINPPTGERLLGARALEMGVDVRYFNEAFTPADFGVPGAAPVEREGGEWTLGLFLSVVLR